MARDLLFSFKFFLRFAVAVCRCGCGCGCTTNQKTKCSCGCVTNQKTRCGCGCGSENCNHNKTKKQKPENHLFGLRCGPFAVHGCGCGGGARSVSHIGVRFALIFYNFLLSSPSKFVNFGRLDFFVAAPVGENSYTTKKREFTGRKMHSHLR